MDFEVALFAVNIALIVVSFIHYHTLDEDEQPGAIDIMLYKMVLMCQVLLIITQFNYPRAECEDSYMQLSNILFKPILFLVLCAMIAQRRYSDFKDDVKTCGVVVLQWVIWGSPMNKFFFSYFFLP